ncbi:MAG: hypothetical protein HYV29_04535 [Ignavibacteriales bacterium]|nr:hypothetical protein [Ignavibacteriales bacterium]
MKYLMVLIAFSILVFGCDLHEPISTSILLTDTTGRETSTFSWDEHFDVKFTLTNNTDGKIAFTRNSSAPDIRFSVYKGDSLVCSSTDGYAYLMIMSTAVLDPGQSLRGYWRGPTTSAQDPKISLAPGKYLLKVTMPKFNDVYQIQVQPTSFTVEAASD